MPLKRVDPGTIPRRADPLQRFYEDQENQQTIQEWIQRRMQGPDPEGPEDPKIKRFAQPRIMRKPEERENIDLENAGKYKKQNIKAESTVELPSFSGASPAGYWGKDPDWQKLSSYQKAAAMSLLEADAADGHPDLTSAKNVLGAMVNRADKGGEDLGEHVSKRIYQPTIEPAQYRRLQAIIQLPEFQKLSRLAEMRDTGQVDDWVDGATHFLAHEPVMEGLREKEPNKYRSWVGWTGYDKGGGQYSNPDGTPVLRDRSHAFLAPEGRHSANRGPLVDMERHSVVPSDMEPPVIEDPGRSYTASAGSKVAAAEPATKLPKLSEVLFGVDKPVLGNLLGLKLGSGIAKAGQGIAQSQSQDASLQSTSPGYTFPEQDQGAFALPKRQSRQAPQPARLPMPRRQY